MLDFQQIKAQYPTALQVFEKGILREYLQYKILQGIFESKLASRVAFMGGTALRIIYGNNRFSEDIDLENFGISWAEFEDMVEAVRWFLSLEGFEVELKRLKRLLTIVISGFLTFCLSTVFPLCSRKRY